MGYSLIIGEKKIETEDGFTRVWAEDARHDSAPAFGDPTDYTNERWPSYSTWNDFCRNTGLYDLFYTHEKALIYEHPGWQPLTLHHQAVINAAYKKYKRDHPTAQTHMMPYNTTNGYLCRLEWLKYWVDWALENCKNPVFCNS